MAQVATFVRIPSYSSEIVGGKEGRVGLGSMVCPSFVLGGDAANTGSAGYVCLETELMGWESDFHAAKLAAFAFAALLGLSSFFAVVCPGAATLFVGGENDFNATMPAAFVFAALMGWPSCFAVDSPAVPAALSGGFANTGSAGYVCLETELVDREPDFFAALPAAFAFAALMGWPSCFVVDSPAVPAALSGVCFAMLRFQWFFRRFWVLAAMLFWAALSEYSLEFLFGAVMLIAPLATENTRLFILLEMVQVVFCAENWVPGSSSQEVEAALF